MLKVCVCIFLLDHVISDLLEGWNYISLHCRDNDNKPVDWWYLYKPPSDNPLNVMESGKKFSFITPNSKGKWEQSTEYITSGTMLKHTLSPMFRDTYANHLGVFAYHSKSSRNKDQGSYGHGVMLADEQGGLWMGHTMPGFPDLINERVVIPAQEIPFGHMFICLSLDLVTLNGFASSLKIVQPNVTRLRVPSSIKKNLPSWHTFFRRNKIKSNDDNALMKMDFKTLSGKVNGSIVVRRPGDNRCLYRAFAKSNSIGLDVYGHDQRFNNTCKPHYSVRNINAISLKHEDGVYYINNNTDRMGFAVSTAAHWQRGGNKDQYWTCTSSPEKDEANDNKKGKGSLLVCLQDYNVWRSFDMLKVKEPEC